MTWREPMTSAVAITTTVTTPSSKSWIIASCAAPPKMMNEVAQARAGPITESAAITPNTSPNGMTPIRNGDTARAPSTNPRLMRMRGR